VHVRQTEIKNELFEDSPEETQFFLRGDVHSGKKRKLREQITAHQIERMEKKTEGTSAPQAQFDGR
jgi:hypothetical protein